MCPVRRIALDAWRPADGKELERAALEAVRSTRNMLVVAGPGAGKTELLAQRACFLLETETCPTPRRILALSFKRDAAKNLAERVEKRSGHDLARRFSSRTFEAFTKSLIDRFGQALPPEYRPTRPYRLLGKTPDLRQAIGTVLRAEGTFARGGVLSTAVETDAMFGLPELRLPLAPPTTRRQQIAALCFSLFLAQRPESFLTFAMIGQLAEFLLSTNAQLLRALRATYSHVFLDEFQDTTGIQYAFTRRAFVDSSAVLTAVGDSKQRIMVWAGALRGVFDTFEKDFSAKREPLLLNHRSAPRLVQIQHILARRLDPQVAMTRSGPSVAGLEGICELHRYRDDSQEAEWLSAVISGWITGERLAPRDISVLTKIKPEQYAATLLPALNAHGVSARNEEKLQDLLAEAVPHLIVDLAELASRRRSPDSWARAIALLEDCRGGPDHGGRIRLPLDQELGRVIRQLRADLASPLVMGDQGPRHLLQVFGRVLAVFGLAEIKAIYPQYQDEGWLRTVQENLIEELLSRLRAESGWGRALDDLRGVFSLPVMTIHKSKGLEYDSVVFLGLEDRAFWNFAEQPEDDTCAFFVALSRAKRRVLFTFCDRRDGREQSNDGITALYNALGEARVPLIDHRGE